MGFLGQHAGPRPRRSGARGGPSAAAAAARATAGAAANRVTTYEALRAWGARAGVAWYSASSRAFI